MKRLSVQLGIGTMAYDFTLNDTKSEMMQSWIPIVLISTCRLYGTRELHRIVLTGFDADSIYINDPFTRSASRSKPPQKKFSNEEFKRMNRYGKNAFRCCVFIGPPVNQE